MWSIWLKDSRKRFSRGTSKEKPATSGLESLQCWVSEKSRSFKEVVSSCLLWHERPLDEKEAQTGIALTGKAVKTSISLRSIFSIPLWYGWIIVIVHTRMTLGSKSKRAIITQVHAGLQRHLNFKNWWLRLERLICIYANNIKVLDKLLKVGLNFRVKEKSAFALDCWRRNLCKQWGKWLLWKVQALDKSNMLLL